MAFPGTGRIINGLSFDYSSITVTIDGIPYQGVTEISYSDTMEPGVLRGTGALMRGRTRGMYEAEASFTIALQDFIPIRSALASKSAAANGGGGFMEQMFLITVSYREANTPLLTDTIEGCRIKHVENSHSSGNSDGLVTKVDLSVFRIGYNQQYAVGVGEQTKSLVAP